MRKLNRVGIALFVLLAAALAFSACQPAAPAAPSGKSEAPKTEAPKAEAKPVEAPKAEAKPAAKEAYKLGLEWEATGAAAAAGVGAEIREGALLEAETVNAAGGIDGHPLQVLTEDNGSDPTKTATLTTKLARDDKVNIVLGPAFAPIVGGAITTANREQTPHILGGVFPPEMRDQKLTWTLPGSQPDELAVANAQLQVLKDKGYKKVVGITTTSPQMQSSWEALKKLAPAAGIQILDTGDTYGDMDMDVTAQVQKVKALANREKAEALVLEAWFLPAVTFMKGMKQLGLSLPVIGPESFADAISLKEFGAEQEGATMVSYKLYAPDKLAANDPQKPLIDDFIKRFKAKYNKAPGSAAQIGADWIKLSAVALKASGGDRAKTRDALRGLTNQVILGGVVDLSNYNHYKPGSLAQYEIHNSSFQFIKALN